MLNYKEPETIKEKLPWLIEHCGEVVFKEYSMNIPSFDMEYGWSTVRDNVNCILVNDLEDAINTAYDEIVEFEEKAKSFNAFYDLYGNADFTVW